jgi:release factor glutamine methyltransferase
LPPTIRQLLDDAASRLAAAGVQEPRRDARLLLAAATNSEGAALLARDDRPVEPEAVARFAGHVARRERREPVSRILGSREFWSLPFILTPALLDPRPDSEALIEAALDQVADRTRPLRLLDLGTGSGCLLIALLWELPNATGLGVDREPDAVAGATANAEALGLGARARFRPGDWGEGLAERFDLIVANPPYIPDGEIAALAPEVAQYEPRGALAGGPDGLDAYRALAGQLAGLLAADGRAVIEFGQGQDAAVAALLRAAGLEVLGFRHDLSGVVRCVVAGPLGTKK